MGEENLTPIQLIQKRKNQIMCQQTKEIDWDDIEKSMVQQWYAVQKIMSQMIPSYFPYITFQGITECIKDDPNFKSEDDE